MSRLKTLDITKYSPVITPESIDEAALEALFAEIEARHFTQHLPGWSLVPLTDADDATGPGTAADAPEPEDYCLDHGSPIPCGSCDDHFFPEDTSEHPFESLFTSRDGEDAEDEPLAPWEETYPDEDAFDDAQADMAAREPSPAAIARQAVLDAYAAQVTTDEPDDREYCEGCGSYHCVCDEEDASFVEYVKLANERNRIAKLKAAEAEAQDDIEGQCGPICTECFRYAEEGCADDCPFARTTDEVEASWIKAIGAEAYARYKAQDALQRAASEARGDAYIAEQLARRRPDHCEECGRSAEHGCAADCGACWPTFS